MLKHTRLYSILFCKCPRCHQGKMFKNPNPYALNDLFKMPENCPECGQKYDLEPGFYWGAMYVSYGLNVGIVLPLAGVVYYVWDFSFWAILVSLVVLQIIVTPYIFRISRAIWLNFFVGYDPSTRKR
ncbi:MAG: DUF983 domain-containing protein [Bacteroidia bacterium]